jgi:hypothetical protein
MNERIKELIEQATTYLPKTEDSGEGWIFDKEKFAELIVRDCVSIVENQGKFLRYDTMSKKIKQHFGVK